VHLALDLRLRLGAGPGRFPRERFRQERGPLGPLGGLASSKMALRVDRDRQPWRCSRGLPHKPLVFGQTNQSWKYKPCTYADLHSLIEITIPLQSRDEAVLVLGPYDRFAKLIRQALNIELFTRNGNLRIKGEEADVEESKRRVDHLLGKIRKGRELNLKAIEEILLGPPSDPLRPTEERRISGRSQGHSASPVRTHSSKASRGLRLRPVEPRSESQRRYLELIEKCDLCFGCGVAGTGKTFLAVAAALEALRRGEVRRLVITRPVVEAGENLGFLPGDLQQKLNPYVRPIYDALSTLLEFEDVTRLEDAGVIEMAPLAYMRGRTLSESFVILDEAQNTSVGQMKMFLTRLGEGSRMVVTGDPTQNDLAPRVKSGLNDAVARLRSYEEVGIVEFGVKDVVRHDLVAKVIRAYETTPPNAPREDQG
jgi:phosphate starvation-inducible protein PhoH and related proteins